VLTVRTVEDFRTSVKDALEGAQLTTVVAKVEPLGPSGYVTDLSLVENRFQFRRYVQSIKRQ
jgi:sulfopyruvate decarboxylase subunit beta